MSVPEALADKHNTWPSQEEQYQAQERFDSLRKKLEERPYAMGVVDDIHAHSENGVYVSQAVLERQDELLHFTEMRLMPGAFIGAGDSLHEVMFAQVEAAAGDEISDVDVAIKPHDGPDELQWAVNEHDKLLELKDKGFDTLEPLAVFKDNDRGYLITEYRPDIDAMDSVDWTVSPRQKDRFEETVVPNLEFIAQSMAFTHSAGIFRKDPAPKNFFITDRGGMVVADFEYDSVIAVNDEEHTRLLTGGPDETVSQENEAIEEMKNFWYFVTRPWGMNEDNVLMPDSEPKEIFELFCDIFYPKYKASLLAGLPPEVSSKIDMDEFDNAAKAKLDEVLESAY